MHQLKEQVATLQRQEHGVQEQLRAQSETDRVSRQQAMQMKVHVDSNGRAIHSKPSANMLDHVAQPERLSICSSFFLFFFHFIYIFTSGIGSQLWLIGL